MPTGDALLSGYYLNELLLSLLARDDPHPALFDIYANVVQVLASEHGEVLQAALRTLNCCCCVRSGCCHSWMCKP
jgi:DNA repair protein RecO (recombination protein O)